MCGIVYSIAKNNHVIPNMPSDEQLVENVRQMFLQMRCFLFVIILIAKVVICCVSTGSRTVQMCSQYACDWWYLQSKLQK